MVITEDVYNIIRKNPQIQNVIANHLNISQLISMNIETITEYFCAL